MAEGNGTDLGHLAAMMQSMLLAQEATNRRLDDHGRLLADHGRLLADHGRQLKDLASSLRGFHETVTHYHASVLGHGILITELQDRSSRIERHVGLSPAD